jgi:hypothetical protein
MDHYPQLRRAKTYAIVDHQLMRQGYLRRLSHQGMSLYLLLVVVGDRFGKSYYSHSSLKSILRLSESQLFNAINELIQEGLIAHSHPNYYVKNLTESKKEKSHSTSSLPNDHPSAPDQFQSTPPPKEFRDFIRKLALRSLPKK